jgi:CheY-like chemotaxis protein
MDRASGFGGVFAKIEVVLARGLTMSYEILMCSEKLSPVGEHVQNFFKADCVPLVCEATEQISNADYRALVVDCGETKCSVMDCGKKCLALGKKFDLPVVFIAGEYSLADKLAAYEAGCDDIIDPSTNKDEACARITKSIFHRIANEQLSKRLQVATETVRNALMDNSALGSNIQFLLAVHQCDNLDQLGQQLFATLERYNLRCSLQMRSTLGIKNMEAHGMSKDLESQLLFELKDAGRYIDFGSRTICNYDRVSLLVKNMPVNDPESYGGIKDNTFYLLQGVNARIHSLEDRHTLIKEKQTLRKLSTDVNSVMVRVKERYQEVMLGIMSEVETSTGMLQDRLPHLALTEHDEYFIGGVVDRLVSATTNVFNEGLKVDEIFLKLEKGLENSLKDLDDRPDLGSLPKRTLDNKGIELF